LLEKQHNINEISLVSKMISVTKLFMVSEQTIKGDSY